MARRSLCVAFLCIVAAVAALADGLNKFKDWGSSPQACFMTPAEKTDWAAVKSEEEAQKFVDAFQARRPSEFPAEVAKRAEMADKYLTVGKTAGSKSLRGKVIILLGPPTAMEVSESRPGSGTKIDSQSYANAAMSSSGRSKGGINVDEGLGTSLGGSADSSRVKKFYTFTFRGDSARLIDKDEFAISVEADPDTGKDRLAVRGSSAEVERIFEAAAKASLKHQ